MTQIVEGVEVWVCERPWSMRPVKLDTPDKEIIVVGLDHAHGMDIEDIHTQEPHIRGIPVQFTDIATTSEAVWQHMQKGT